MSAVEHKRDWSDWQPGDDGCSCSCGFNGTFEECAESRALESAEWVTAPDGEEFRVGQCQGHAACPVERHEHGCFADDGTNCDHAEEHPGSEGRES